jgi:iron complex transport system substrate-binding protein
MAPERVVSLIPSATEIVYALDCGERVVGRSHECDHPDDVRSRPVCTAAKLDPAGPSVEIDRRVKAIVAEALSVYRVDEALLERLAPDLIVTQTQCDVCAVSFAEVEQAVAAWSGAAPEIVSLAPGTLEEVWADIDRVARALGVAERGQALVAKLERRAAAIAAAAPRASGTERPPTVACIEWIEPLMAAGNWVPELVEMAGGANLFGEAGRHAPWMTWDQLRRADPEVVVVMPCGFDIARSRRELGALVERPGWAELGAVRAERVFIADGNQYFNRPGPRLVDSLEILAELLHPSLFHFGHEGAGWVRC